MSHKYMLEYTECVNTPGKGWVDIIEIKGEHTFLRLYIKVYAHESDILWHKVGLLLEEFKLYVMGINSPCVADDGEVFHEP